MAKPNPKSNANRNPDDARKSQPAPNARAVKAPVETPAETAATMDKPSKKSALRESILARKAATKPIAFSLDEVRAIAQTNAVKAGDSANAPARSSAKAASAKIFLPDKPAKPNHVKAASISDILGFNPKKPKAALLLTEQDIPEKFRRYFKLLMDLRSQLTEGIERHSEESLKRSAKDDAGDLSAYGQSMSDGGINTFDRDFVLSLVSNEQEALSEIDAAIKRIHDGTYGVCEITGKPISKDRLLAVPFARNSAEAQKELEKNRYRGRAQTGIFSEMSEEGGKMVEDDSGGDD